MPTYVYRRPDGTTFESFQKISDDPLTTDPDTGVPVERVISGGAGLQFKGSGFYLTDYVKKSGSADSAEPGGKSSADAKSPKKAADKTAAPTSAPAPATSSSGASGN